MSENAANNVGEIVVALNGRDKGKYFVILGYNDERLILADGDRRKYDSPKLKNARHVRYTGFIAKEVVNAIDETGRVTNAKLRYVLQNYLSNHIDESINDENRKGDEPWPRKI